MIANLTNIQNNYYLKNQNRGLYKYTISKVKINFKKEKIKVSKTTMRSFFKVFSLNKKFLYLKKSNFLS